MRRALLLALGLALVAVVGVAAIAASSWVAGTVRGVVVPSEELEKEGFKVYGFDLDLGKVYKAAEAKAEFAVYAPYEAKLVIKAIAEGPVAEYKIVVYDSSGEWVASLTPYEYKAELPVKKGLNKFVVELVLAFKEVEKPEPFKLVLYLEKA